MRQNKNSDQIQNLVAKNILKNHTINGNGGQFLIANGHLLNLKLERVEWL